MSLFIHCMYSRYPHQEFGQSNIKTDVDRDYLLSIKLLWWALFILTGTRVK